VLRLFAWPPATRQSRTGRGRTKYQLARTSAPNKL
jgi:hypothetical protein